MNENYTLNLIPQEISHYDTYVIRFDRLLQKGDIVKFTVEWECKDENGKARPFFSTTILEPIQKLKMKLQIDDDSLQIDKAYLEVAYTEGGDIRSIEDKQMVDCITEWVIEKPEMLNYYKVRWILK